MKSLESYWYSSRAPFWLLPLSWAFRCLAALRRLGYRLGVLRSYRLPVPVIVVGNISVGGTGKTPLVVWLIQMLQQAGYSPGIVSRGYGGQAQRWPQQIRPDSDPVMVGDEPVMLAQRCGCPVVAAPDRVTAARQLLKYSRCNIIVTDDGLQHYRLQRDIEIAVIDAERRFGNGQFLPAGPLREGRSRLEAVDFVVANGFTNRGEFAMQLEMHELRSLVDDSSAAFSAFTGQQVHALAGIGNPQRFFQALRNHGLDVIEHPLPDHHQYTSDDVSFDDDLPVLMTEKDAVKCRRFASRKMWYVPVEAVLPGSLAQQLLKKLKALAA